MEKKKSTRRKYMDFLCGNYLTFPSIEGVTPLSLLNFLQDLILLSENSQKGYISVGYSSKLTRRDQRALVQKANP